MTGLKAKTNTHTDTQTQRHRQTDRHTHTQACNIGLLTPKREHPELSQSSEVEFTALIYRVTMSDGFDCSNHVGLGRLQLSVLQFAVHIHQGLQLLSPVEPS